MPTDTPASSTSSLSPSVPSSPPLSPRDERLLNTYLNRDLNLFAVCREEAVDPLELMRSAARPEIKEQMRVMRAHRKIALESLQETARMVAIETLKNTASDGADPVERRRAASTLMRGFGVPAPKRARAALQIGSGIATPRPEGDDRPGARRGYEPLEVPDLDSRPGGPTIEEEETPPSSSPPPRPPSTAKAAAVADVLLNSGTIRRTLEILHRHNHNNTTYFGAAAPQGIVQFMDKYTTGPLADFINTAPRDITPSLLNSDDRGDTYTLGPLSFRLTHNGYAWAIASLDST